MSAIPSRLPTYLKIITARKTATTSFSTSSTSFVDITGLSVSVSLPVSSCVLVFSQVWCIYNYPGGELYQQIVRGTTPIRMIAITSESEEVTVLRNSIIQTLEINVAPGTYTYKLQGCVYGGTGYWDMTASPYHGEISVIAFPL